MQLYSKSLHDALKPGISRQDSLSQGDTDRVATFIVDLAANADFTDQAAAVIRLTRDIDVPRPSVRAQFGCRLR
ncbi:hypothetical protein [Novipirellula rosea]|uniref:Uncharacterized protein n=1 Tax=Novipirellula rosea TaxID=1031540 RepID=A0ABP8MUY3_9BACT